MTVWHSLWSRTKIVLLLMWTAHLLGISHLCGTLSLVLFPLPLINGLGHGMTTKSLLHLRLLALTRIYGPNKTGRLGLLAAATARDVKERRARDSSNMFLLACGKMTRHLATRQHHA
jgi:hypothetical protein